MRLVDTVSQITIKWTKTSEDIVRYVVDVRQYLSAGPGKTKNESIIGYPREIPATLTQHAVRSLGELVKVDNHTYSLPFTESPF